MTEVDPTQHSPKRFRRPLTVQLKFVDFTTTMPKLRRVKRPYP